MKKTFKLFTLLWLAMLTTTFWSCVDPNKTNGSNAVGEVAKLEMGDPQFPSTSVGIKLNVANIESYVYKVDQGENIPTPDAVMMYAEAKEITAVADGEHKIFIYGMEGNKSYTIHFAMKIKDSNKYLTKSISTTTPNYSRLINLISADRFEIKVQFNVPAGQHFKYVITDQANYFGRGDDLSKLRQGILKQGPQIISYKDNGPTGFKDYETGEDVLAVVKPGAAFVVLMVYCDKDGNISYTGGDKPDAAPQYASAITPNEKSYTEKCSDPDYKLTDPYAKLVLVTAQPKVGEGDFVVESFITELSSIFRITPPPSVLKYAVNIMDEAGYNQQVDALTEDGVCEWIQRNSIPFEGKKEVSNNDPLEKGVKYKLILIGQCDQSGETQIRQVLDFEPSVSTKPAVVLEVKDITTPADGPYKIVYNVKAPNKDCYAILYILNYVKEIEPMLGSGMTYSDIIFKFGQAPLNETWIEKINSNEGLDLPFDTFEDMNNRLIIASFNDDEKMQVYHLDIRSAEEPAKTRVDSPLFSSMLGDWNVEFKYRYASGDGAEFTANFVTKIVDGPAVADPSFKEGDATYAKVLKYYYLTAPSDLSEAEKNAYAKKALADELANYNEAEPRYKRKYREQNRVVMTDFCYNENAETAEFMSSWDLFCHTTYASYDVDQMFFDYGPKLFLEIHEGGKVTLETNRTYIAPFSYTNKEYYAGGYLDGTSCFTPFDVTLEGNDKMTINRVTSYNGVDYPFAIITSGIADIYAVSDIVMTRATPAQAAAAKQANNFKQSLAVFNLDKKPRRTSLAGSSTEFKKFEAVKIPFLKAN